MVLFDDVGAIAMAAGIAIAVASLAAGWAEKEIGSAAVGAMAENEKLFSKGLILTVLPETIIIFAFLVALMLMGKM